MGADRDEGWGFVLTVLGPRQAGIVSRAQLLAAGIDRNAIHRALATGRLHRIHRGVYALLALESLAPLARYHAALLACGDRAVLSHESAASLLGLLSFFVADVHVTSTADRRHPTLTVHRTRALPSADTTKVGRLWTTSIPRTVSDLARTMTSDRAFERLLDEALRRTSARRLHTIPRARALLTQERASSLTWSREEEKLRRMIVRAGLPSPESNVAVGRYHPDLLWREQQLIVEYDSYLFHSGPGAFDSDRERHNHFEALGYHVLHVTLRQLTHRRELVLVQIATVLARAQRP